MTYSEVPSRTGGQQQTNQVIISTIMDGLWFKAPPTTALLLIPALLSGCAQQPQKTFTTEPALAPLPQQWQTTNRATLSESTGSGWLQQFKSPQLETLVAEALQHNHTIARARLSLQLAEQQSIISASALRPTTTGKVSSNRLRTQSSGVATHSTANGLELSTSWEIDLWERLSNQQQATLQLEAATALDLDAAQLSLVAEVARSWFSTVTVKQQITLSEQRITQYKKAESIIQQRYSNGITDALDLHLARSEVAIAEEQLASQQLEQRQNLRKLEILVGRYPAATLEIAETLPVLQQQIPADLPASLLERRPDIAASYQRLKAAELDTLVASKNRLPTISLTAAGGSSSSELHNLLNWDYLVWNLLGKLTLPLFQQQELKAAERQEQIAQQAAAVDYAETVLLALQEVENGLSADHYHQQRSNALARAAHESQQAATLALSRYQGGLIDILTLLDTQQRAYDRQSAHLQATAARIDNRIQLHLALGGDYQS